MVSTKTALGALCVVLGVAGAAAAAADACTFAVERNGATQQFNLSALTHAVGDREHLYGVAADGSRVYVNLCAPTTVVCPANTSVCMLTPDYRYVSRGATQNISVTPLNCSGCRARAGVTATLLTADMCAKYPSEIYWTAVHVACDRAAAVPRVERVVGDADSCGLEVFVRALAGCAGSAAGRQGPAAALIAAALLLAALVAVLF